MAGGQPTAVPSTGGAPCLAGFVRCGSPDDLFVDGQPQRRVGSAGEVVAGTWFYDYAAGQVWVGTDPNGRTVEVSVPGRHAIVADLGRGGQGVTVRNLTIEKYGAPFQECAIQTTDAGGGFQNVNDPNNGASGGWLVQNNVIRLNHGCSVFAGPGTVVADNRLVDNGQMGVKAAGRRVQIVRNEVSRNNFAGHDTYYEAGGAKFWNAIDLVFAYNEVRGNSGSGVWPDYALTGIVIDHNTIADNTEGGVWAEMTLSGAITFNDITGNDAANVGNSGRTHGGIFLFNASNFDVSGNRLADNNGGVVAQVQQRGCIAANIPQGQGACPAGSTLGTLQGTRVHDNQITMTRGFTGPARAGQLGRGPVPAGDRAVGAAAVLDDPVRLQLVRRYGLRVEAGEQRQPVRRRVQPVRVGLPERVQRQPGDRVGLDRPSVRGVRRLAGVRRAGHQRRAARFVTASARSGTPPPVGPGVRVMARCQGRTRRPPEVSGRPYPALAGRVPTSSGRPR